MHQIMKGLWRRSYPRKDSCGIGTHKVEIQPTIDLVEYGGLWPACGGASLIIIIIIIIIIFIHKNITQQY